MWESLLYVDAGIGKGLGFGAEGLYEPLVFTCPSWGCSIRDQSLFLWVPAWSLDFSRVIARTGNCHCRTFIHFFHSWFSEDHCLTTKEEDRMLVSDHSSSLSQYLSNLNMQWITKGYCGNADSDAVDLEWGLRFRIAENLQGLPILLFHWAHWVSKTLDTTSPLLMFLQQLRVAHMHSASGSPASYHVKVGSLQDTPGYRVIY